MKVAFGEPRREFKATIVGRDPKADIAVIIQHTKPPKINHDLVANVCERPTVVARCPVAAIRPAMVNGKPSLEIDETKCMCCGACYPPCPPMQINDPEHSKLAIWVGGKNSNARGKHTFMKMVASGLPNNPPRWPEVSAVVKKILYTYKADARPWERLSDWVERIGWVVGAWLVLGPVREQLTLRRRAPVRVSSTRS